MSKQTTSAAERPLRITETQFQAMVALAFNFYQQGKLQEAGTLFRGLRLLYPQSYYSYAGLGAIALASKPANLTEAQQNLSKAAELNPNDPSVQANLGEILLRQAKFDEAAKYFKRALELDPHQTDPGANRARAIISGLTAVASEVQRLTGKSASAAA
jgi:tetratricopeptide (TPR) repeat protein